MRQKLTLQALAFSFRWPRESLLHIGERLGKYHNSMNHFIWRIDDEAIVRASKGRGRTVQDYHPDPLVGYEADTLRASDLAAPFGKVEA
ncbi:hypothetical protein [Novosphingobium kaempferiae]|uniref:hypothetical protein n=1 Tax=Novosphingobium kaempferiae TaxID=2896849 RepID=UPI001E3B9529|nr:hypothetical protein [Novosphingobium kaempferiae]